MKITALELAKLLTNNAGKEFRVRVTSPTQVKCPIGLCTLMPATYNVALHYVGRNVSVDYAMIDNAPAQYEISGKEFVRALELAKQIFLGNYKEISEKTYKRLVKSIVKGGSMYVVYKGKRIPFGKYVIWDDVANRFLSFNDINALNEALRKYGYVKDHSAVKPGYYTEYGYFSNDILYDLYLKHRFPEVYSPTAQKIVEEHFNEYNMNPEEFRKKLLSIPKVKIEIESLVKRTAVTTANERINQLMQEIEKLKQLVNQKPNYAPILEQLVKQYNSLVELLKSYGAKAPKPIVIQYIPPKEQYRETITFESMIKAVTPIIQLLGLGFVVYMMFKILGSLRRVFA